MICQPEVNKARPLIMHIDLNSCFATVEQQARPLLRGKPVAIVNRRTEHTMIVTASYEAKRLGIDLGTSLKKARQLAPNLIGIESDPPKYRYVYHRLMNIMGDYSAHVRMKSIDEGVIDFTEATEITRKRPLVNIAREIKQRLREEVGCAMRCNIGIGTNRFLAKTAASLNKPDGLDEITHKNLREILGSLELTDLNGIAIRNKLRLNNYGIFTPLQFLDTPAKLLKNGVFKSIVGEYWHQRLRGWEVDKRDFPLRTAGRQYVLESRNLNQQQLLQRLHTICEAVGAKVRGQNLVARGVSIHTRDYNHNYWHARHLSPVPFFSDKAIYNVAKHLFEKAPKPIREFGVSCYMLEDDHNEQLGMFGDNCIAESRITNVIDDINGRFGRRTVHSAHTLNTGMYEEPKIPFGSTRYL